MWLNFFKHYFSGFISSVSCIFRVFTGCLTKRCLIGHSKVYDSGKISGVMELNNSNDKVPASPIGPTMLVIELLSSDNDEDVNIPP